MYPSLSVDFQEKELLILESEFFQEHQCQRGVPEKEKKKRKKNSIRQRYIRGLSNSEK